MSDEWELIPTEDGSPTLRDSKTGELFHNRAGAYTEALVNYTRPSDALELLAQKEKIRVLDICFGLGYNSFVLIDQALQSRVSGTIEITAVELEPVSLDCLKMIRFADCFSHFNQFSSDLFRCESENFAASINLIKDDFRQVLPRLSGEFDLVFHDPFSPGTMPELWTVDIFTQYFRLTKPAYGAVFTYSSAKAVRSGFMLSGFEIWRTPAVGAKAGGGTAALIPGRHRGDLLEELSESEKGLISGRSAVPYRDPELSSDSKSVRRTRELEQQAVS